MTGDLLSVILSRVNSVALVIPELEELEDFVPLVFLAGATFFAEAALEGAAVES